MVPWIPYAFVRLLLFFVSGILVGIYFPDVVSVTIVFSLLAALAVFYFLLVIFRRDHLEGLNPGFLGLPILMLFGYLAVELRTESNYGSHLINVNDSISYYTVTITSYPEEKEKSWKELGEVTGVKIMDGWKAASGKILLYVSKDEKAVPLLYGDVLLIKGTPQLVSPPSNPFEFDYKRFLSFKNIYHQDFISSQDFTLIKNDPPNTMVNLAYNARAKSMSIIEENVSGKREQAIASALVLGITDSLDDDLLNAYAASGAIHVLAVSGLHIGILYAIILFFLRPLKKTFSGKWTLAIVSIVCLWSYALLTGLSPSVMRAVTMFTFVALAEPLSKRANIYNTLALSAFCLLLYNPYFIMSVGFQLSYLAVLGIVYLYPRLFIMWTPASWSAAQVWKITCVSLSAQLATFSLGLLYFHQFPVYFLATNLFVIPLSFIVLVSGLLMICLSFIPMIANIIGIMLSYAIKLLNGVVLLTEGLPGSLIKGVHLTTFQCYLLFGLVITFIALFRLRKFRLIYASLFFTFLFSIIGWSRWMSAQKPTMIVYNVRGHSALDIILKGKVYNLSDSVLRRQPELGDFQIKGNRIAYSVNEIISDDYLFTRHFSGGRLIQWNDVVMLQIMDKNFRPTEKLSVDYLVISNNTLYHLEEITSVIDADRIIIDSSNSMYVADNLIKEADKLNYPVYSVLHKGAYVTEL